MRLSAMLAGGIPWLLAGSLSACLLLSGCQVGKDRSPGEMSANEHLKKAQTLIRLGNYEQAYFHLNQALTINPNDPQLHRNMGWLYLYTGEVEKAAHELENLQRQEPNSPETTHLAGALYERLGQHQDAVNLYKRALAGKPEDPQLYYDLGTSLNALNQPRDAIKYFQAGLPLVGQEDINQRTNFLFSICSSYYSLKEFKQAVASCEEAAKLTPEGEEKERITEFMENMKLVQSLEESIPTEN